MGSRKGRPNLAPIKAPCDDPTHERRVWADGNERCATCHREHARRYMLKRNREKADARDVILLRQNARRMDQWVRRYGNA